MLSLIIVKSGTLNLQGCSFSVDMVRVNSIYTSKIPCIYLMPDTKAFVTRCQFRGGGPEKAGTVGMYSNKADVVL